jgi:hypothetical protein
MGIRLGGAAGAGVKAMNYDGFAEDGDLFDKSSKRKTRDDQIAEGVPINSENSDIL